MSECKIGVLLAEIDFRDSLFWDGVLCEIQDSNIIFSRARQISDIGQRVGEKPPDLIVLDLTGQEGDLIKIFLDAYQRNPEVAMIVVTDEKDRGLAHALLQEGAQDWLSKEKTGGYYSLSRSLHYAIWNQVYLKQTRLFSAIAESIGVHKRLDWMPRARQQFQQANQTKALLVQISRASLLAELDARLAKTPEDLEASYYRARLLMDLKREEEGRAAYFDILQWIPPLPGPLHEVALRAYLEAVRCHPRYPIGHVRLGNLFRDQKDWEAALIEYETALSLQPDFAPAKQEMALLPSLRAENQKMEREGHPVRNQRIPVILLVSLLDNNVFFQKLLDSQIFDFNIVIVELYEASHPLPPHQLILNGIGDADLCAAALQTAQSIIARSKAPLINSPLSVLATGRVHNAARFSNIPGLVSPAMIELPRERLSGIDAYQVIRKQGFFYPFLLRSPGFHTGRYFQLIANEKDLATAVANLPGEKLLLIEYLDPREKDGKFRKYRVVFIDGKLYPVHLSVSHQWKNHYFSADMSDSAAHRDEDASFLGNFESVLGRSALGAIEHIGRELALDYGGVDFGLDSDRKVLLFEANTGMSVNAPPSDPCWDYRREAVSKIKEAMCRMLFKKIGKQGEGLPTNRK